MKHGKSFNDKRGAKNSDGRAGIKVGASQEKQSMATDPGLFCSQIQPQMVYSNNSKIQKAAAAGVTGGIDRANYWHFYADSHAGCYRQSLEPSQCFDAGCNRRRAGDYRDF